MAQKLQIKLEPDVSTSQILLDDKPFNHVHGVYIRAIVGEPMMISFDILPAGETDMQSLIGILLSLAEYEEYMSLKRGISISPPDMPEVP